MKSNVVLGCARTIIIIILRLSKRSERMEKYKMSSQWKWYVYIIECLDDTYYTGMTWKPELRLEQHLSGLGSKYTSKHGVKSLVYYEEHTDINEARAREKQIKGWSQDKKRKILIDNFKL